METSSTFRLSPIGLWTIGCSQEGVSLCEISASGIPSKSLDLSFCPTYEKGVVWEGYVPHTGYMRNFDYTILNPRNAVVNEQGHTVLLAHTDRPGYLSVDDFDRLAEDGKITIHETGGSELAAAFGRIRVAYTIN